MLNCRLRLRLLSFSFTGEKPMAPTVNNGKICYLELPAKDVPQSVTFYQGIFGWSIRSRGDGVISFDDSTGQVSGMFVTTQAAAEHPGMIVSIMVDDIRATIQQIEAFGCLIEKPLGFHPTELIAHFRDPGGNLLGLYQEPVQ
jgi:predicted enzyme related to lactoylglutathione lyase